MTERNRELTPREFPNHRKAGSRLRYHHPRNYRARKLYSADTSRASPCTSRRPIVTIFVIATARIAISKQECHANGGNGDNFGDGTRDLRLRAPGHVINKQHGRPSRVLTRRVLLFTNGTKDNGHIDETLIPFGDRAIRHGTSEARRTGEIWRRH